MEEKDIKKEEIKELTPDELKERLMGIQELASKLQQDETRSEQKILSIGYKEEFVILPEEDGYAEFATDVYLVKIEQDGVISYQIFSQQQELIATMTQEGEIVLAQEFLDRLDDKTKALLNAEGRDDIIVDFKSRENIRDVEVEFEEEKDKEEKEEIPSEGPATEMQKEEIEEDLGLQNGDLAFEADILDPRFQEVVPEARDYEGRVKFCRVKASTEVMIIGKSKETGKYQQLETIGTAQSSSARPIKLDENGNEISRENINGIMRYDDKYSFAYTISAYGELDLELLREARTVESGYQYISCGMETRTQYPVNEQVRDVMDHTLNEDVDEEIGEYDRLREEHPTEDINLADITDEMTEQGIIRLSNGETTTFEMESRKAKVTPVEFERIYRKAPGATPEEKINNTHDEINEQYRGPDGKMPS